MKPKISLILPAYNVAEYIEACIHSCEHQDLPPDSYEIIIVNDGSTDSTPPIIQKLAKIYNNIKIINQDNQGLSVARNNGVKEAQGEFIWFIDSDDTIATNCLSTLTSLIETFNLDTLAVAPSIPFKEQFPESFDPKYELSKIYNGIDFLLHSGKFVVGAWCYIFKRSLWEIHKFQFHPGICYEDTQLIPYVLSKTSRVAALTKFSCYNYMQRAGSIMNTPLSKHKLLSNAILVNTHLKYARETDNPQLRTWFRSSASSAFINGIKQIIQMGGNKTMTDEFLGACIQRPTSLYGSTMIQRLYQYLILHYPRTFIQIGKWKRK